MPDPRETLNRIRKQANNATEGPWEVGDRYHCQSADKCDCAPDRGPLIDTYQHPKWGTMHVHRKGEPWWNEGVLFRKAGGPPGEVACDLATEGAEFTAAARTTVPRLLDALEKVLERHAPMPIYVLAEDCEAPDDHQHGSTPDGGDDLCWDEPTGEVLCCECRDEWGERVEHPCPDYTAITTALEGENHD